ncbi:hypothetical protein WA158_008285 [Blastocystis sp. Blastoise]
MVNSNVPFDVDRLKQLNDDITVYEEFLKDVIYVFSSVLNLGIHSGNVINRLTRHIGNDSTENGYDNYSTCTSLFSEKKNEEIKNVGMDLCDADDDNSIDLIRFTNSGPVFQISKSILDSVKGSFIDEQRCEECRTNDGTIFLNYEGNDAYTYYLLDHLNGKNIDISSFSYEEQLELLSLFEFCELAIPIELMDCRERRDTKMKKYENGNDVDLFLNGNKNDSIKDYLIKNELWNDYIMKYNNGFIDYNHIKDSLFINREYEYIEYIDKYIETGSVEIKAEDIYSMNRELLESEMYELFGDQGREAVEKGMNGIPSVFVNSKIIEKKCFEIPLVNWLGQEKKWKLLFRASKHNYSVREFHRYCDNKGETVTIIKHIGHDNHVNIFGGYTDQDWNSSYQWKPYSKEFLFTLSNEHGIPPTQYNYTNTNKSNAILCYSSYGPTFGRNNDIFISDDCHNNANSWCSAETYAEMNNPKKSSLFVNTNNYNTRNKFKVEDYEVWGRA